MVGLLCWDTFRVTHTAGILLSHNRPHQMAWRRVCAFPGAEGRVGAPVANLQPQGSSQLFGIGAVGCFLRLILWFLAVVIVLWSQWLKFVLVPQFYQGGAHSTGEVSALSQSTVRLMWLFVHVILSDPYYNPLSQTGRNSSRWISRTECGVQIQKVWLLCLVLPQPVIIGNFLTSLSLTFFTCKMVITKVL